MDKPHAAHLTSSPISFDTPHRHGGPNHPLVRSSESTPPPHPYSLQTLYLYMICSSWSRCRSYHLQVVVDCCGGRPVRSAWITLACLEPCRVSLLRSDCSLTSSETFHNVFGRFRGDAVGIVRSRSSHHRCHVHDGVRARVRACRMRAHQVRRRCEGSCASRTEGPCTLHVGRTRTTAREHAFT